MASRGNRPKASAPASSPWWFDPISLAGLGGAMAVGTGVWGLPGLGLSAAAAAAWFGTQSRNERRHRESLAQQERMALQLMRGADPEALAHIMGAGDIAQQGLYQFLEDLKANTGGESTQGTTRLPGEQQMEAVAPGILLNLTHDLGTWYARLDLKGDAAKAFLKGMPCSWRGRGKTPDEAIQAAIAAAGQAHKRQAIAEFAERMVEEG